MKTYRSANGTQLGLESVLCRDDAARRAKNAGNAAETYAGWRAECARLLEEAATDDQKRIARGYAHVAELRVRFEQQLERIYGELASGREVGA